MVRRSWVLFATLLLATALVSGCTKKGEDATPTPTTPTGSGGNGTASANISDFNITESGPIVGPFSQSWSIEVENVAFTSAMIHFALTGAQAGAPPTAHVNLQLIDPDGNEVISDTLGLGGSGNAVDWSFTSADLPAPGTYTLQAVAGSQAPLPSVGLANYELSAMVMYG
ncbi:MAG TPA: hypothetical protein VM370_06520 [Candidatus Thermoplasmatota archaeon]|nr:hypothetical protein [Candidatus Thermoplasmatota archaeon]